MFNFHPVFWKQNNSDKLPNPSAAIHTNALLSIFALFSIFWEKHEKCLQMGLPWSECEQIWCKAVDRGSNIKIWSCYFWKTNAPIRDLFCAIYILRDDAVPRAINKLTSKTCSYVWDYERIGLRPNMLQTQRRNDALQKWIHFPPNGRNWPSKI